jgi:hypothetical protein
LTALATVVTICWFSTEHGPAIITSCLPPTATSPILTMLDSGLNSRDTSLYGLRTGITFSTPGNTSNGCTRRMSSGPITPMMVRSTPADTKGLSPSSRIFSTMWATCFFVASGFKTMIIASSLCAFRAQDTSPARIVRLGAFPF